MFPGFLQDFLHIGVAVGTLGVTRQDVLAAYTAAETYWEVRDKLGQG